jgi:hypothetical protein
MALQTSSTPEFSTSTTQFETSTSSNATVSAASLPSTDDNAALIGGIGGGIVALLLFGCLVALLVARSRRREKGEANSGAALQSVRQSTSGEQPENNYGVIAPQQSDYEHGDLTNVNEF